MQSEAMGRSARILEKDVWVCWALNEVFSMPAHLPMAFKGGTSLSKVFDVINRFSEDVDVTIDYRALDDSIDPFSLSTSRKQQDALVERLEAGVVEHIREVLGPHLRDRLAKEFGSESYEVEVRGQDLWIRYESALTDHDDYVQDAVKLEFGGRNLIVPSATHIVQSYMAPFGSLTFPQASVTVLAPERTFWEKATLIHAELSRASLRSGAERLSRHWYDLYRLAQNEIGNRALEDLSLLRDVVKTKKIFYRSAQAHYDDCLNGGIRLIPMDDEAASYLGDDFQRMVDAQMFYENHPQFTEILDVLSALASKINEALRS
jgi:predicted nucleotidyltransferase component of viral defense system